MPYLTLETYPQLDLDSISVFQHSPDPKAACLNLFVSPTKKVRREEVSTGIQYTVPSSLDGVEHRIVFI